MKHKAWSSIEEVPYCFSRSSVKFQGHTTLEIVEFDPNWAFPDCNSSLKSPMATKWCTKLEVALKSCPIVFQGHPSNFKVIRDKTLPILTQIGHFRTIGRSQLSNPSDLPCFVCVGLRQVVLWSSSALAEYEYKYEICIALVSRNLLYNLSMGSFYSPEYPYRIRIQNIYRPKFILPLYNLSKGTISLGCPWFNSLRPSDAIMRQ